MFYLTTHSTHFIYGYKDHSDSERGNPVVDTGWEKKHEGSIRQPIAP